MRQIAIKSNSYQPNSVDKRKLGILIIGVIVATLSVWMFYNYVLTGSVLNRDRWDTTNGTFTIRVHRRPEILKFLPGYFYYFQSQSPGSNKWHDITTLRFDDPLPIPRNQVRFVNNQVGYLFMISSYAVTTDEGRHWSVFNVRTDPPLGRKDSYLTISEVQVDPKGTGTMTVYSKSTNKNFELQTDNYGQHWRLR